MRKGKSSYVLKGKITTSDELFGNFKKAPKERAFAYDQSSVNNYRAKTPVRINDTPTEELQKIANQRGKMNKWGVRYDSDGWKTSKKKQDDAYVAIQELKNRKNGKRDVLMIGNEKKPTYIGSVKIGSSQDPFAGKKELTHPRAKKQKSPSKKVVLGKKCKGKSC